MLEIKNIAVEPVFQKKGLGRALIAYIENTHRQPILFCWWAPAKKPHRALYENAASAIRIESQTSSPTTTTIPFARAACRQDMVHTKRSQANPALA